jgi:hypothetical protein
VLIELLEGDAGFDRGVEIIRTDLQDPVHLGRVDADPAA